MLNVGWCLLTEKNNMSPSVQTPFALANPGRKLPNQQSFHQISAPTHQQMEGLRKCIAFLCHPSSGIPAHRTLPRIHMRYAAHIVLASQASFTQARCYQKPTKLQCYSSGIMFSSSIWRMVVDRSTKTPVTCTALKIANSTQHGSSATNYTCWIRSA